MDSMENKKKYKGIVIADIHIGVINIEDLYNQYKNQFLNYIKEIKDLDFIIIAGDFFDHKLFLNDKESTYAYRMIKELVDSCNSNTKIRIVYGTESHECNQYNIISNISDNIKVIKYAEEELLFDDLRVLYLPEEHILDKNEYYKEYFKEDKKYDYVFGHGIIREAMKEAAIQVENKGNKIKKVPVFSTAELKRICKGQVYFGHYHVNTDLDDVFYVGSFTRWQYGEDTNKGFYKLIYNKEKNIYKNEFIVNELAEEYKTISFGYNDEIFENMDNMNNTLEKIDKMIKNDILDHVRFQFNLPKDNENPEFIINYIKERYKFKDNKVKINFTNGYIEEKKNKNKEEVKKENDKYGFIFDKNMEFENKTAYFINIEYNKDIPSDRVDLYLNKPLNEILDSINEE